MKNRKPTPPKTTRAKNEYRIVAVGWYTEENWEAIKNAAADPARFENTYAEWCRMAAQALIDLESSGILGQPLYVESNELLAWCRANDKPNDGASRAMFVSEKIRQANED
jgi:hypothetical protein